MKKILNNNKTKDIIFLLIALIPLPLSLFVFILSGFDPDNLNFSLSNLLAILLWIPAFILALKENRFAHLFIAILFVLATSGIANFSTNSFVEDLIFQSGT